MAQTTALLINDTSNSYHWGCYGTSMEIKESLTDSGYVVESYGAVDIAKMKSPPRTSAEVIDAGFQQVFLDANTPIKDLMASADVVFINGEGTLHGAGQAAFNLLFLAHLAKHHFGKPVHGINMSVFPNDSGEPEEALDSFYQTILSCFDRIAVREPRSLATAQRLGLKAVEAFDCLPRYFHRHQIQNRAAPNGPLILGGGLGLEPQTFAEVIDWIEDVSGSRPLHYLVGAQDFPALDDEKMAVALQDANPSIKVVKAETFGEWVSAISSAGCLVSGRFHHTIAALYLDTPSIVFRAGTPKIDGLCSVAGLPAPFSLEDPSLRDTLVAALDRALSGQGPSLSDQMKQNLVERAARNFESL